MLSCRTAFGLGRVGLGLLDIGLSQVELRNLDSAVDYQQRCCEDDRPKNNNNNKMSSDMRSVPDVIKYILMNRQKSCICENVNL